MVEGGGAQCFGSCSYEDIFVFDFKSPNYELDSITLGIPGASLGNLVQFYTSTCNLQLKISICKVRVANTLY